MSDDRERLNNEDLIVAARLVGPNNVGMLPRLEILINDLADALEGEAREVLSVDEVGIEAVLSRDFYTDPTAQWVYMWADERFVIQESNGTVADLEHQRDQYATERDSLAAQLESADERLGRIDDWAEENRLDVPGI